MNKPWDFEAGFEPERYELDEAPAYRFDLDRRSFVKLLGGVVVLLLLDRSQAQETGRGRFRGGGRGGPRDIGAWLHIDGDGAITVYTGKVEVGQNIRTSLAQIVAEELRVGLNAVQLVMGDTQLTPYDAGTFGSQTTPVMSRQLQRVAAAARDVMIELAAAAWQTEPDALRVDDGHVIHSKTQQSIAFGKLTQGQKLTRTVSDESATTPSQLWKVAGQSATKVNGQAIVTARHRYTSDMKLDGMLYGRVLRPASFGATLGSLDMTGAEAMPDVVLVRDGDFVGVAAPSEFQAERAIAAIKADWNTTAQISSRELFEHLKSAAGNSDGRGRGRGGRGSRQLGSIADGLNAADFRLSQTYDISYIAHAPLEPRAAVAQWDADKVTVWTGTQRPFGVQAELARAFGMPSESVRVIVPDTGSGYGGKHTGEAALEAARIARAAGKPVKVVWSREEEFTWAYLRPAGVIQVTSGVRKDGTLTAWEFHNYNSGASAIGTLYQVPNQRIEFHSVDAPLRQGSYRALASTANIFARETHMDELAHAVAMDPLEFRLKNLQDERLRAVFRAAAQTFGWDGQPPPNHGFGIGGGFEKGSYLATCAEVAVDRASGQIKVVRAVSAFDCGTIINPDQLKNQIEGAMIMGLGGALFEAIEFGDGRITNPRFSQYRVPRFQDAPQIEVVLLDRRDLPSAGAGETPIVGIAPAIGNAIFAASGMRLRSLPLAPSKS